MIAIIDYGMGNIHSVQKALESFKAETIVTNKPEIIGNCHKVVLPGVGAFDDAIQELKKQNLISALINHIKNKKPFLGICLGLQFLFEASEEALAAKGLGVLKGKVVKFQNKKGFKVPHMGWNQLKKTSRPGTKEAICPLLKDVTDNSYVYFCHSYYPQPADRKIIAATTDYLTDFAAVVWKDNLFGVQFHPEKSQEVGLKMIKNFVEIC